MSDVLSVLGIEPDEVEWQDFAICSHMDTNLFFDEYESDENVARMIDEACLSCPVLTQCLMHGMENGLWGVWGGIYLTSGKQDKNRNSHKTQAVWEEIREKISG